MTMVELVYLTEQAGPLRMNTVFKFYVQTWALWGVAAGAALASLVVGLPNSVSTSARQAVATDGGVNGTRRVAAVVLVVVLVVSTSSYAFLALGNHFANPSNPTLDATAFVDEQHPEEAAAIDWVDDRTGQPTLLSAPGTTWHSRGGTDERERGMYAWTSNPASSLTGVPTVAGWHHEVGYRGDEAYLPRVRDVDAIYEDSGDRAALLAEYDVRYVWVGPTERARYGEVSFADTPGVDPVHRSGAITIYRVDQSALSA